MSNELLKKTSLWIKCDNVFQWTILKQKNSFIYSTIQIENIHFLFVFLFCLFSPRPFLPPLDTSLPPVISRAEPRWKLIRMPNEASPVLKTSKWEVIMLDEKISPSFLFRAFPSVPNKRHFAQGIVVRADYVVLLGHVRHSGLPPPQSPPTRHLNALATFSPPCLRGISCLKHLLVASPSPRIRFKMQRINRARLSHPLQRWGW